VAIPTLEGWILALLGENGTEDLGPKRVEAVLVEKGVARKNGLAMVQVVANADLDKMPRDARSLSVWLARARQVLPALVARQAGENRGD
jgi:hypothetical protein